MQTKDNLINDTSFQKLLHNDNYYQYIFKKTEKIVSVTFYIINNIDFDKKSETQISNLASKAHLVHEHSLRSLEAKQSSGREVLEQFTQALIGLDSTFRIALAMQLITPEILSVVSGEIDTVIRGLSSYMGVDTFDFRSSSELNQPTKTQSIKAPTVSRSQSQSAVAPATQAAASDRRERIKTILEAKGEATIKDISEIITDCSEKTIQRELNTMIDENLVKRQGERRWSKYSIF